MDGWMMAGWLAGCRQVAGWTGGWVSGWKDGNPRDKTPDLRPRLRIDDGEEPWVGR